MGEKLNELKETATEIKSELKQVKNLTVNNSKFVTKGVGIGLGFAFVLAGTFGGLATFGALAFVGAGFGLMSASIVSMAEQKRIITEQQEILDEAAKKEEEKVNAALAAATNRPQPVAHNATVAPTTTTIDQEKLRQKLAEKAKQEMTRTQKVLAESNAKQTTPPNIAFTISKYAKNTNGIPIFSPEDYEKIKEELNKQAKSR